ncbi:hypothetical protein HaLaN_18206 [Haematococcus lacustris]|uniref:Uncharacterized protein n=1 Tax=Haematococcus lacustris TaxID=44745 RepID=A0A699ZED1_HAELA|nr:hypothetical protein HaLaN_18206 [Haematococcus lacustris]
MGCMVLRPRMNPNSQLAATLCAMHSARVAYRRYNTLTASIPYLLGSMESVSLKRELILATFQAAGSQCASCCEKKQWANTGAGCREAAGAATGHHIPLQAVGTTSPDHA